MKDLKPQSPSHLNLGKHTPNNNNTQYNYMNNKSSDGSNSNSPGFSKSASKPAPSRDPYGLIMRRGRLSTISSEMFPEEISGELSPKVSFRGRRKSSNFDMLCDPIKYQDYVNKYLDGIEEEEESKTGGNMHNRAARKRTRSSNFIMNN